MGIYEEIINERKRQDGIWGGAEHDDQHTKGDWLSYINSYCFKARDHNVYRGSLIKLSALAVAAIEAYDRKELDDGNV